MISRRITAVATLFVLLLVAGSIVQAVVYDFAPVSIDEARYGPVRIASPVLDVEGRATPLSGTWRGPAVARLHDWTNDEMQKLFGPTRVVVLWTTDVQRAWLRAGSVCTFLFRHYGESDGLITLPALSALKYRDMQMCSCVRAADRREFYYVYSIPEPRCGMNALVFWTVPWKLDREAPDAEEINPRLDHMQGFILNAVLASVVPEGACANRVGTLARALVTASAAIAAAVVLLFGIVWSRSSR